ncbi:MAG: 2'-5' RNA ligase family protein [Acidobacteriota bacterium]
MTLLVLVYPELSGQDYAQIQEFRKQHDNLYYGVVEPHFTIVFAVSDWAVKPFIIEIQKQAQGLRPFDFCLRSATINKDAFNDFYHAFLVPDEGYSRIAKLHDRLYADKLFSHRRLDIDFIPHVGIGNSKDPQKCIEIAQSWNRKDFAIAGRVSVLDIVNYENKTVRTLQQISLSN